MPQRGQPVTLPIRESKPQGEPMEVQVWDSRKSEDSTVMVGIEIEPLGNITSRASGQTSALVSLGEKGDESTLGGKATVGSGNTSLCALHHQGCGHQASIAQVTVVVAASSEMGV
jgi:hypothetical protein